eukprot:TRINITY_DN6532_c0_g1_i1.p1 TRINITY_DN6532_c0_g1~~TRINITY_DN6532_c0_g1_i1.p1  ORF type:complete len:71 (+),score=2.41 TRINITY_DN6532_c0_g1_i1:134-346(+)
MYWTIYLTRRHGEFLFKFAELLSQSLPKKLNVPQINRKNTYSFETQGSFRMRWYTDDSCLKNLGRTLLLL